jgi:hypothetical protein
MASEILLALSLFLVACLVLFYALRLLVWLARGCVALPIWLCGRVGIPIRWYRLFPAVGFPGIGNPGVVYQAVANTMEGAYGFRSLNLGGYTEPSSALLAQRLRPRARWVRAVEYALGGRHGVVANVLRGRWQPDLPSPARSDVQNYLLGTLGTGVRILGGGYVRGGSLQQAETSDRVYFIVDDGEKAELVFPALLGKLRIYALGRERNGQLFGALRTRAQSWCKGVMGDAHHISDLAVASAVALAMNPSEHEVDCCNRAHRAIQEAPSLYRPLLS